MNGKNNGFKRLNRINILKVFTTLSLMFFFFMLPSFSEIVFASRVSQSPFENSYDYYFSELYFTSYEPHIGKYVWKGFTTSSPVDSILVRFPLEIGGYNNYIYSYSKLPFEMVRNYLDNGGIRDNIMTSSDLSNYKLYYDDYPIYTGALKKTLSYGDIYTFRILTSYHKETDKIFYSYSPIREVIFSSFVDDKTIENYIFGGILPDGVEVEDSDNVQEEPEESDFWIENLQSYEKRGSLLSGIQTYVSWDSLNLNEFPDVENLTVEAKINFTTEHKQTHATNSYTDVPLFEGIPDTDTQYKFTNYDFLSDYCSKNGIDDSMLLYQTDKISCRYKYTKTVDGHTSTFYTPWQGTGETHNGANNPLFKNDLNISNLAFTLTNNNPELIPHENFHYKFTWDNKDSYDENTYMVVTSDIKWKPTIGKLNSVNNVPYIVRGDLLASNCEVEFTVSDAWKKYFDKEGIDYSVFSSQWVENYYFQVFKKINGEWHTSNIVRVNMPTSSIQGSILDVQGGSETGKFDETTGEWVPGSYDNNGNFVPEKEGGDSHRTIIDGTNGTVTDRDNTNIGDWGLPDDMSVIDYITSLGESLVKNAKSLFASVGEIPKLVGQLFTWIPFPIVSILCLAILVCILLRILGR